jgi:hypothetical protein
VYGRGLTHRLWLDDVRKPPFGYDLVAKTADEAIAILQAFEVEHCSLDHDLGLEAYATVSGDQPIHRSTLKEKTGYDVLLWMEETDRWCPDISIHTMNPKGAIDMMLKLEYRAPSHVQYRRVWPRAET